ncbi:pentatricopeptide repeat-containing protein At1g71420 [Primulina huaijiensis]|uniref:pentatricopeptide repeat-containing protein At1g71420 n=1 Tax=Primulina huaijiensis TaxID=1492673 RepID=UPI003CC758D2
MKSVLTPISVSLSRILKTAHQCQALRLRVQARSLTGTRPFDLYAANHLINKNAKCGRLDIAHQLFSQMPHTNIVSWTALISGYAQYGHVDECFGLFSEMLFHIKPNDFAYASVFSVCDYKRGVQAHGLALKTGCDGLIYVGNALVGMYWKNGSNSGAEACRVFEEMGIRNLITYNSMIAGFGMHGQSDKAISLFKRMFHDGVDFDRVTFLSLNSSICGLDNVVGRLCCSQLHCVGVKIGLGLDVGVATALVKAYSTVGGDVSDCHKLFLETTSSQRDVVMWTGIMTAFSERAPEEALLLYNQMSREHFRPDCYVFSILLKACSNLMTERHAAAVHSQVIRVGFVNVPVLNNALIHAYARCGSIDDAKQVFHEMPLRDIISWNSMLKAYAIHGDAEAALNFFEQMDVVPDDTTIVALLSLCSHTGMVKEGTEMFETMLEKYGVVPQLDHYACMVDILGRAGHLTEAKKVITNMPMEPDFVVWSAFLGACRKHGETRMANLASSKLKELDPENSLGYVMISNIYCSSNNFDQGGLIRNKMNRFGVRKEPGLSWTEVGNRVHEFASGGQRHPWLEAICVYLEELLRQLKKIGYVPTTSLVLYDVEEEHKVEHLYHHSEKLALAFSLMNAGGTFSNGGVIKIMKNIRICIDCHNFMRIASIFVQKVIIVRDANRFHHFKEGACSCNNYW